MKPQNKKLTTFIKTISQHERIAVDIDKRRATTGNTIAKLLGGKRETAAQRQHELQVALDKTYALKAGHGAVSLRPTVHGSVPNVLIKDSETGKPEINYGIFPGHGSREPQTLAFEKQSDGNYDLSLHHYSDGVGLVADPINFEGLNTTQQDAITAMVSVIGERFERNPHNFEVAFLPSPYLSS